MEPTHYTLARTNETQCSDKLINKTIITILWNNIVMVKFRKTRYMYKASAQRYLFRTCIMRLIHGDQWKEVSLKKSVWSPDISEFHNILHIILLVSIIICSAQCNVFKCDIQPNLAGIVCVLPGIIKRWKWLTHLPYFFQKMMDPYVNENQGLDFRKPSTFIYQSDFTCDLFWRNKEQVASDIWLISDGTNQQCMLSWT